MAQRLLHSFVVAGSKFSAEGYQWIAEPVKDIDKGTAMHQMIQVWKSKKTWYTICCRVDVNRETLIWEIERYVTRKSRGEIAKLVVSMTREKLDNFVDYLAAFGDETEKRYARMIHKKKGNINCLFPETQKEKAA